MNGIIRPERRNATAQKCHVLGTCGGCGEDEDGRPASGNGRHRALDLKTRRAAPVNSSPAVGHPADAGPCPAQGSRTPPHKATSIPVNVLPSSSSPQQGDLVQKQPPGGRSPLGSTDTYQKTRPKLASPHSAAPTLTRKPAPNWQVSPWPECNERCIICIYMQ